MKKMIDSNGRLFGKISIIDLLVLLVGILLIAAFYCKFVVLEKTSTSVQTEKIVYEIELKGARTILANNICAGDTLFEKTGGNAIGTIVDVEVSPAKSWLAGLDGVYVLAEKENRCDVVITIEGEGTTSSGHTYINRTYELNAGSEREVYTKYCAFTATIMGVNNNG